MQDCLLSNKNHAAGCCQTTRMIMIMIFKSDMFLAMQPKSSFAGFSLICTPARPLKVQVIRSAMDLKHNPLGRALPTGCLTPWRVHMSNRCTSAKLACIGYLHILSHPVSIHLLSLITVCIVDLCEDLWYVT